MIFDSRLEFSDAQALSGAGASPSTNVIDISQVRNIGKGRTMYVVVAVEVAVAGTSPTIDVTLETDDNDAFASAAVVANVGPQITDVNGVAGAKFVQAIPYSGYERYLRLNYTLGGTTPTGTVNAFLTDQEPESWEALTSPTQV